jgi:hypothetical protein
MRMSLVFFGIVGSIVFGCATSSPNDGAPQDTTPQADAGGASPDAAPANDANPSFVAVDAARVQLCTIGQTQACANADAGPTSCLSGTQTCQRAATTGDVDTTEWGPCVGWTACDAGVDASCVYTDLTWTFPWDGYPKNWAPSLAPNEKLVAVESVSGFFCVDASGNCMPCAAWNYGTIAADGKSFSVPYGDFDNDNSGACTFVLRAETCN